MTGYTQPTHAYQETIAKREQKNVQGRVKQSNVHSGRDVNGQGKDQVWKQTQK